MSDNDELKRRLDRLVAAHRAANEAMQPAIRAAEDALRTLSMGLGKAVENALRKAKSTRGSHADER